MSHVGHHFSWGCSKTHDFKLHKMDTLNGSHISTLIGLMSTIVLVVKSLLMTVLVIRHSRISWHVHGNLSQDLGKKLYCHFLNESGTLNGKGLWPSVKTGTHESCATKHNFLLSYIFCCYAKKKGLAGIPAHDTRMPYGVLPGSEEVKKQIFLGWPTDYLQHITQSYELTLTFYSLKTED